MGFEKNPIAPGLFAYIEFVNRDLNQMCDVTSVVSC